MEFVCRKPTTPKLVGIQFACIFNSIQESRSHFNHDPVHEVSTLLWLPQLLTQMPTGGMNLYTLTKRDERIKLQPVSLNLPQLFPSRGYGFFCHNSASVFAFLPHYHYSLNLVFILRLRNRFFGTDLSMSCHHTVYRLL